MYITDEREKSHLCVYVSTSFLPSGRSLEGDIIFRICIDRHIDGYNELRENENAYNAKDRNIHQEHLAAKYLLDQKAR